MGNHYYWCHALTCLEHLNHALPHRWTLLTTASNPAWRRVELTQQANSWNAIDGSGFFYHIFHSSSQDHAKQQRHFCGAAGRLDNCLYRASAIRRRFWRYHMEASTKHVSTYIAFPRASTDCCRDPNARSRLVQQMGVPITGGKKYPSNTIFLRHRSLELRRSSFIYVHPDNHFAKSFEIDDDGQLINATRSCEGNRNKTSI